MWFPQLLLFIAPTVYLLECFIQNTRCPKNMHFKDCRFLLQRKMKSSSEYFVNIFIEASGKNFSSAITSWHQPIAKQELLCSKKRRMSTFLKHLKINSHFLLINQLINQSIKCSSAEKKTLNLIKKKSQK